MGRGKEQAPGAESQPRSTPRPAHEALCPGSNRCCRRQRLGCRRRGGLAAAAGAFGKVLLLRRLAAGRGSGCCGLVAAASHGSHILGRQLGPAALPMLHRSHAPSHGDVLQGACSDAVFRVLAVCTTFRHLLLNPPPRTRPAPAQWRTAHPRARSTRSWIWSGRSTAASTSCCTRSVGGAWGLRAKASTHTRLLARVGARAAQRVPAAAPRGAARVRAGYLQPVRTGPAAGRSPARISASAAAAAPPPQRAQQAWELGGCGNASVEGHQRPNAHGAVAGRRCIACPACCSCGGRTGRVQGQVRPRQHRQCSPPPTHAPLWRVSPVYRRG